MPSKEELRALVRARLTEIVDGVNRALSAQGLDALEPTIKRLGRGGRLPHWYEGLKENGRLPNLDGKTIGSVLEMLFVAVLETGLLRDKGLPPLRINPARGVDLPDFDLGVKSPSTNFCTSEPFFSAYERLYGNEHDAVILLTDYQESKKRTPFTLKITAAKYLAGSEMADAGLCKLALKHRDQLLKQGEGQVQRFFRFLAFVNQSDWRAKQLVLLANDMFNNIAIHKAIDLAEKDFQRQNQLREKRNMLPLPDTELTALTKIKETQPLSLGILDGMDNWLSETVKDAGRAPNGNEWQRLRDGPLNGKIGMSFALQWRYNFGRLFVATSDDLLQTLMNGQDEI